MQQAPFPYMSTATFHFAAELWPFLAPAHRGGRFAHAFARAFLRTTYVIVLSG